MPASKKYRLFASEGAVCAFFSSPAGCRNGDQCKFRHELSTVVVPPDSEERSVVSSESEPSARAPEPARMTEGNGSTSPGSNPFVNQVATKKIPPSPADVTPKKKKRKSNNAFANPKDADTNSAARLPSGKTNVVPSKKIKIEDESTVPAPPDFRNVVSHLPVASFSIPGITPKLQGQSTNVTENSETSIMVLPTSSKVGKMWSKTVERTREHEKYQTMYDWKRLKEQDRMNGVNISWFKARPYGPWCADLPKVIAVDCEMCETTNPETGQKNSSALCRISVVNGEKPDEVLLDTLVKPSWPITNYRSRINGIKEEHLNDVSFTVEHAQTFMKALCSEETVVVGHSVDNDLAAIKMEHNCVVDTACLFRAQDSERATVALRDVVTCILKQEMPSTHDSVHDARQAFFCAQHFKDKGGKVAKITRTPKNEGHKLFLHRLNKQCAPEHISAMFLMNTDIQPKKVQEIEFKGEHGKTHAIFRTVHHASIAFDTLGGKAEEDASGRLQKKIYLKNGSYVRVRKMTREKKAEPKDTKPSSPPPEE